MTDDVRRWSDELAGDPRSLAFLPLAETLRRQGQLDVARKVAMRGLQRHPHNAEAHDLFARILVDRGELDAAFDEWDMVLRLAPSHPGAIKGMAFIRFQQGRMDEAEQLLLTAQGASADAESGDLTAAIDTVRRSSGIAMPAVMASELPSDPHNLFDDLLRADQAAMLLDKDGLVLAGSYRRPGGADVAQDVGAHLSGVSDEATRATRHLAIGAWRSIVFETEAAVVCLAPGPAGATSGGGVLVVAASPTTPLGSLRRIVTRCLSRVTAFMGGEAGSGAPR